MSLRLVHPAPAGQSTGLRPSHGKLTDEELRNLGAAIRYLTRGHGGVKRLAREAGVPRMTLQQAARGERGRGSAALALAVSRAARVSIEQVLSGKLIPPPDPCPTCGKDRRAS